MAAAGRRPRANLTRRPVHGEGKKRLTRRSWADETHDWIERYLLHFARKALQEGPREMGTLYADRPGDFAMTDVAKLMREREDEFELVKGPRPQRKYARAS